MGVLRLGSANLYILQVCENTVRFAGGFNAQKWDILPAMAIAGISGANSYLYEHSDGTYNYVVTGANITDDIESLLHG